MRCLAFLVLVAGATAVSQKSSPMEKVIELLREMKEKAQRDMADEAAMFGKFSQWCKDTVAAKTNESEDAQGKIDRANGDIEAANADIQRLEDTIATLKKAIADAKANSQTMSKVRVIENRDFTNEYNDLDGTIKVLKKALEAVHAAKKKTTHVNALVQIKNVEKRLVKVGKEDAMNRIAALLQGPESETGDAHSYDFQSDHIVKALTDMRNELIAEKEALRLKAEEQKHSGEMYLDKMKQLKNASEDELATAKTDLSNAQMALSQAEGEKGDYTVTRDEANKVHDDTKALCNAKSDAMQARTKLRNKELEAMDEAMEIISREAGNAAKNLDKHESVEQFFVQMGVLATATPKAADLLAKAGERLHSKELSALAVSVGKMRPGTFDKIMKMIRDMINKLEEQATAETSQKGWCDKELRTNEFDRKTQRRKSVNLKAQMDLAQTTIETLSSEITDLEAGVAQNTADAKQAADERDKESFKNEQTTRDCKDGQAALSKAIAVLKDFYAEASKAESFVQTFTVSIAKRSKQQPEIFDEPYTGQQGTEGGIVGVLEVILEDFVQLEQRTEQEENEAKRDYTKLRNDLDEDSNSKTKDIEHKTTKRAELTEELNEASNDNRSNDEALAESERYFEKLKTNCIDAGESVEERIAARTEEIESLKQALEILENNPR